MLFAVYWQLMLYENTMNAQKKFYLVIRYVWTEGN